MATIIRGKRKGEEITPAQMCNDWVMSESREVFGITSLQFTPEEAEQILNGHFGGLGQMLTWFAFDPAQRRFRRNSLPRHPR